MSKQPCRLAILAIAASVLAHIAACKQNHSTVTQTLGDPVISSCDLTKRADIYNSRSVTVRGILVGYHEPALYNPACDSNVRYIRADFDAAARRKLVDAIAGLGGSGYQRGNFWANVVLVGRFETISNADCQRPYVDSGMPNRYYISFCYRLVVSDVSDVSAVSPNVQWPE